MPAPLFRLTLRAVLAQLKKILHGESFWAGTAMGMHPRSHLGSPRRLVGADRCVCPAPHTRRFVIETRFPDANRVGGRGGQTHRSAPTRGAPSAMFARFKGR